METELGHARCGTRYAASGASCRVGLMVKHPSLASVNWFARTRIAHRTSHIRDRTRTGHEHCRRYTLVNDIWMGRIHNCRLRRPIFCSQGHQGAKARGHAEARHGAQAERQVNLGREGSQTSGPCRTIDTTEYPIIDTKKLLIHT
ncbi:hypothetical protein SeMB42_g06679 [Synchytrium endobioticum]|uniref:Uncharacterized protein n=1 Tax=Synchytrium endobioticum TaxID=286115 RepID=A0A507CFX9_9FUNG|nr:hypothetical protein SeMB42_g06682 [Synchytrium endobioticum]TPX38536.1 hypothetical protein SeMB42_g06679 [Synchytrium endobioticum]